MVISVFFIKRLLKGVILFGAVAVLGSCEIEHYNRMSVDNRSPDTLCVYVATGYFGFGPTAYPDTLLPINYDISQAWGDPTTERIEDWLIKYYVQPFSKEDIIPRVLCKSSGEISPRPPCDTLSVFIICRDSLLKYGYEHVRDNYMILARYDIHWKDAMEMDYVFPYPPDASLDKCNIYISPDK